MTIKPRSKVLCSETFRDQWFEDVETIHVSIFRDGKITIDRHSSDSEASSTTVEECIILDKTKVNKIVKELCKLLEELREDTDPNKKLELRDFETFNKKLADLISQGLIKCRTTIDFTEPIYGYDWDDEDEW